MKLIANNGEVLAEWTAAGGKRNLYCHGGFGLMLTRKALARCIRADDVETIDMFKATDPVPAPDQVEADAVQEQKEKQKSVFSLFCLEI